MIIGCSSKKTTKETKEEYAIDGKAARKLPAAKLLSVDEYGMYKATKDIFVLGAFLDKKSPHLKTFFDTAKIDNRRLPYSFTVAKEIINTLNITEDTVYIFKDFDEKINKLTFGSDSCTSSDQLLSFLKVNSVRRIWDYSHESQSEIYSHPIKIHVLFFIDEESEDREPIKELFNELSSLWNEQVLFVKVDDTEEQVATFFGINLDHLPAVVLADLTDQKDETKDKKKMITKQYPYKGDLTVTDISAFITSFFDGGLTPVPRSEPVLADDLTHNVVIVRNKNFKEVVIDNDKDVLVEFYAPYCGHCRRLAPTYEEVGRRFKPVDSVIIAKFDGIANDIPVFPGIDVRGYPTIYFFRGDNKTRAFPHNELGRDVGDFIFYVKRNAATPISLDDLAEDLPEHARPPPIPDDEPQPEANADDEEDEEHWEPII